MDCSPPGSSAHGILQARILESVAISFSRGSSRLRDRTCVSCGSCIVGRFFTAKPPGKTQWVDIYVCIYIYLYIKTYRPILQMKQLANSIVLRDFPGGPVVKDPRCNAADLGLIPGQGN